METFSQFLAHDLHVSGGNAIKMWPPLLDSLYPCLRPVTDLSMKLSLLCQRAFANRLQCSHHLHHFVEYWCGKANLTKEMIKAGFEGGGFDIIHSHMHSCLDTCGLRLWMDMLMSICEHGLCWLGPPCSSFVILCLAQSQRYDWNQWWGDTTRTFVRTGNSHMQVAAMMFLVSCVIGIMVCLEQPDNSCLHKCLPMRSVLSFVKAHRVKTYLGAFAGPTQKPLQIWTNRACFFQLSRDCPAREGFSGEQLVTRSEDGRSFTGRKDLLEESGTYTPQFGSSVAQTFASEFLRLRHVWVTFVSHLCQLPACSVLHYMENFCLPNHWQLLQIRFSTHVKHHVFDLIIGFLGKNSCPCRRNSGLFLILVFVNATRICKILDNIIPTPLASPEVGW